MSLAQLVSSSPPAETTLQSEDGCVRVSHVARHSPAAQGGLRVGDLIACIDGRPALPILFNNTGRAPLARGEHVYECYRLANSHGQARTIMWRLKTTDGIPLGIEVEPTVISAKRMLTRTKDWRGDLLYALWKLGDWRALAFHAGRVTGLTYCPTCWPAICNEDACGPCNAWATPATGARSLYVYRCERI